MCLKHFVCFPASSLYIETQHCDKAYSIASVVTQSPLHLVHYIIKIQCLIDMGSRKGLLEAETLERNNLTVFKEMVD